MRTFVQPKRLALVFLLFVVACKTPAIDLANEPHPGPEKTSVRITSPYPPPTDKITPQPIATLIVLTPIPATDAMKGHAAKILEPYFKDLPFIDQALPSPLPYREYFGCVNSTDTGGIVSYYVSQNLDSIVGQFDQYINNFPIETDGWKDIEESSFLGKAVTISARQLPEKGLPLLMTFRASIYDYGAFKDHNDSQSDLSAIWVEVTLIENLVDYQAEDNGVEALVKNCQNGQWWLSINPAVDNP